MRDTHEEILLRLKESSDHEMVPRDGEINPARALSIESGA